MDNSRLIIELNSWRQLKSIASVLNGFIFRGVGSENYRLVSPLQREFDKWGCPAGLLHSTEQHILYEFKRRAHNYVHPVPNDDALMDWWALIRHYGGPARFIDFSLSCYISAYFAMINGSTNAAIWAISRRKLEEHTDRVFPGLKGIIASRDRAEEINKQAEKMFSGQEDLSGVIVVDPVRLNRRMLVQQGVFLFPLSLQLPFEKQCCKSLGYNDIENLTDGIEPVRVNYIKSNNIDLKECSVIKIIIPKKIYSTAVYDLFDMNISSESLFPGLEGLAGSLIKPLILWNKTINYDDHAEAE